MINEEHSRLIKKTIGIRELEQKIAEMQAKKAKGDAVKCHRQADIEVGGNARRCRGGARG